MTDKQEQIDWLRAAVASSVDQHRSEGAIAEKLVLGYYEYGVLHRDTRDLLIEDMLKSGIPELDAIRTAADAIVVSFLGIPVTMGNEINQLKVWGHYVTEENTAT